MVNNELTGLTRLPLFCDVKSLWPLELNSNKDVFETYILSWRRWKVVLCIFLSANWLILYRVLYLLKGEFYFLSGAYNENLYAIVFASSVTISVKFSGSFMLQLLNRSAQ